MVTDELIEEFKKNIDEGRLQAQKLQKAFLASRWGGVCVMVDGKKYVNPKYLSFVDSCDIIELCKFVKQHPTIDNEDLLCICKTSVFYFGLFKDLLEKFDDLANETKTKSELEIALIYSNMKVFGNKADISV